MEDEDTNLKGASWKFFQKHIKESDGAVTKFERAPQEAST